VTLLGNGTEEKLVVQEKANNSASYDATQKKVKYNFSSYLKTPCQEGLEGRRYSSTHS
jgi:hypothetical protein